MPLLEVTNLAYWYPDTREPVFAGVSFSLEAGEMVLLTGDCGSGKSTLLKCLCGIVPHLLQGRLEGEVRVAGKWMGKYRPAEVIRHVGVVWQNVEAQILQQTVEDELVFGPENLGYTRQEMTEILRAVLPLVQLGPDLPVASLSGGQKQRLVIGSVLATGPSVLLLDEPLANLDPPAVNRLLGFLGELCRQGTAVLMAEHRQEAAAPYVRRIIRLEGGTAVEISAGCGASRPGGLSYPVGTRGPAGATKESDQRQTRQETAASGGNSNKAVLEIEGLTVAYRPRQVISNLDLQVNAGERVVILGHNGSGKSTLLKTLCGIKGLSTVSFSLFRLNGKNIRKLPADFSGETGLVMQNPHHQLFMDSVRKEIAFGSGDSAMVEEILELFALKSLEQRHPFTLSQGQKRLLALAAVLAHRPSLLLLDEPTIGQDYASLDRMLTVLSYISREWGTSILTATHDRYAAKQLADRVILLEEGKSPRYGGRELIDAYFGNTRQLNKGV